MATLAQLQGRLDEVEQAISDSVTTGSQYSFSGSHSRTSHSLGALEKLRTRLRRQILRFRGNTHRAEPSYGSATSDPPQN